MESTTASKTPITAAWMPKEMMSEDSEVLMAVSRLVARVLFEPTPKTSAGVAAMVEVLKPKLYQHFGDSQSSNGLLLLRDEQSQLAGMAGVVVEKLPGFQDEVPRVCYLVIDPRLHGQGFGSMLMRQCEDWAAARGHRAIWLFVLRHKEGLCQWYSKMGYQTVDEHRTALRCRYQARARWKARCRCWDGRSLWRGNLFESIFLCILCAFDGDHSETLRSFKFVHLNVWSTTEGIVSTILDSLSCRGFWLAVKLYRHTGTLSLFDPSLCDCMDSLCSDEQKELCVACFPVNMRTWSIET